MCLALCKSALQSIFWCSLVLFLCVVSCTSWALPIPLSPDVTLAISGQDRVVYNYMTDFPLDETGASLGAPGAGQWHHRLRLSPSLHIGKELAFGGQMDLLLWDAMWATASPLAALPALDATPAASLRRQVDGFRPVDLRQLWLSWRSPIGDIKVGQMTQHWGLGMLINDGQKQTGEFALPRFGDLSERLMLSAPVLRLFSRHPAVNRVRLVIALDLMFRDEEAELLEGDLAFQLSFALFYKQRDAIFVGLYYAYRNQQDRNQGPQLEYNTVDLFVHISPPIRGVGRLDLALEAAYLFGSTSRLTTEVAPEGLEVASGAFVARVGMTFQTIGLRVGLEVGAASGDQDPNDTGFHQWPLDPDYQPSLLIFRQLLSAISARAVQRLSAPARAVAEGRSWVARDGRINDVFYFQPVLAWRASFGQKSALRHLEVKLGWLYASRLTGQVDPYNTWRAGGVPTTHLGLPAAERAEIGAEINVSVGVKLVIWKTIQTRLLVLYGHLFPGAALIDEKGEAVSIDLLQARWSLDF